MHKAFVYKANSFPELIVWQKSHASSVLSLTKPQGNSEPLLEIGTEFYLLVLQGGWNHLNRVN